MLHVKPPANIDEATITLVRGRTKVHQERQVSYVFVLDTNKQPLVPTRPARARSLLTTGKAAVWKRFPFTIILKRVVEQPMCPALRMKIDPGSHVSGLAVVNDRSGPVVFAAEISHRGQQIVKALQRRHLLRKSRRQRKTRYRQPRFLNRRRKSGWLPPFKTAGVHVGRVSVRAKDGFAIATRSGKVTDIGKQYCTLIQRRDGYGYQSGKEAAFPPAP